ncbi:thiolase [Novosphingobium sp. PS1R-30]|uniref:Thiolase n=1 Tax=Novosphingobium anseongense TaxID=3133436 RepID=A0ABU8S2D0_9SPHN
MIDRASRLRKGPRASIAGIGATPYYFRGESAPQTIYEMIGKAILAAVADAGLSVRDIDGMAFYSYGFEGAQIVEQLGLPELNFAAVVSGQGGGSAGVLDLAAMAIETGRAKAVICIGACQQIASRYGQSLAGLATTPQGVLSLTSGLTGPGQSLALFARRHMHAYGTRREAFAEVVMASRAYAASRPEAIRKKQITLEDYFAAPMLADPLCRYDFCVESDAALAFVVTSAERARDLRQKPVDILGAVHGGKREWGRAFFWMNQPDDLFASSGARAIAERLYGETGVAPADIDVALLYDHFSPLVVMQLEDYGFCGKGEGGPFVESGAIRPGGAIPVNPHGGQLSECYVIGMTQIREAVEQLRGTATNQVSGASLALVTGGPAPIPMSAAILGV